MLPVFAHALHSADGLPLSSNGLGINQSIYASIVLSRRGETDADRYMRTTTFSSRNPKRTSIRNSKIRSFTLLTRPLSTRYSSPRTRPPSLRKQTSTRSVSCKGRHEMGSYARCILQMRFVAEMRTSDICTSYSMLPARSYYLPPARYSSKELPKHCSSSVSQRLWGAACATTPWKSYQSALVEDSIILGLYSPTQRAHTIAQSLSLTVMKVRATSKPTAISATTPALRWTGAWK